MNKYNVLLDIIKDRILFPLGRCDYNKNYILLSKDLTFLLILILVSLSSSVSTIISYTILKRVLFVSICENEPNISAIESKILSSIKKLETSTQRSFNLANNLDIIEIEVVVFYILIKNKSNKFFNLILSEIHESITI